MTMRLSEAMRLGAMLHPQGFGHLLVTRWDKSAPTLHIESTCALGAAAVAIVGEQRAIRAHTFADALPGQERLLTTYARCPACASGDATIQSVVAHLNDSHRWTREQIAAWVETIERAQDDPATPIEVPCLTS